MRKKGAYALAAILMFLSGCVAKQITDTAFEKQIEQNSRSSRLYNNLKTVAIGSLTLLDRKFVDSYLKLYMAENQPSVKLFQEKKRKLYSYLNKTTFIIRFYSPEDDFKNLDGKSRWQISFDVKGKRLYPLEIKRIKPPEWSYLYDKNSWSQRYIVRFDTKKTRGVVVISSILGRLKFDFRDNSDK